MPVIEDMGMEDGMGFILPKLNRLSDMKFESSGEEVSSGEPEP